MGMAASQARFLSLTARQSNTEYQGQQINQERTALANESSNIFSQLSNMEVPTPPNTSDFYHTVYTFSGTNVEGDGASKTYTMDNIFATPSGDKVKLSWDQEYMQVANASFATSGISIKTASALSTEDKAKYSAELAEKYANMKVTLANGESYHVFKTTMKEDENLASYLLDTKSNGSNTTFAKSYLNEDGTVNDNPLYFYQIGDKTYYLDLQDVQQVGATSNSDNSANTEVRFSSAEDAYNYNPPYSKDNDDPIWVKILDSAGNELGVNQFKYTYENGKLSGIAFGDGFVSANYNLYTKLASNSDKTGKIDTLLADANQASSSTTSSSNAVSSKTSLYIGEYTTKRSDEFPVAAYEKNDVGRIASISIQTGVDADGEPVIQKFELDCTKVEDEEAYEQAMRDYEYEYAKYQKQVSDLNNKTEDIQQKDKTLELELKQLDTEQNALKTEAEAVSKVIQDNTEDTFKTFA